MADAESVVRDSPARAGRPKRWHHTSLAVTDIDLAIAFHEAVFGLEVLFEERGMAGQIASITGVPGLICDLVQMRYHGADQVLEFIAFRPAGTTGLEPQPLPLRPGCAHVAFYVDNLQQSLALVKAHGGVQLGEITEFSDGRSVYCRAPGGSFFEMEEPVGNAP
jgi:predicted enzyme related to lactoylglutathione lyase